MSDTTENAAPAPAKKSKLGLIVGVVVAVVTLVGGALAGAVLGPRLLGGDAPKAAGAEGEEPEAEAGSGSSKGEPEKIVTVSFPPVVVDLRDQDERIRHLKVGVDVELPELTVMEEFRLYIPRARDAMLTYLRSLTYEEVTDPTRYAAIKEELSTRVSEAVGKKRIKRLLIVEFVSQ